VALQPLIKSNIEMGMHAWHPRHIHCGTWDLGVTRFCGNPKNLGLIASHLRQGNRTDKLDSKEAQKSRPIEKSGL